MFLLLPVGALPVIDIGHADVEIGALRVQIGSSVHSIALSVGHADSVDPRTAPLVTDRLQLVPVG